MPITLFNLLQATCKWNFLHDPCWSFNPVACYELSCGLVLHLAPSSIQTLGIDSHPGSRLPAPKKDSLHPSVPSLHIPPHPSTSLHIPPLGPHLRHVWIQENWVVADHHRVLPQSSLAPSFDSKQQHLSTLKKSCRVSCAERQPQLLNCSLEIHLADERKRASYVREQVHLDVRHTAISCATSMVSMQNLLSLLEEDFREQQTAWKFTKSTSIDYQQPDFESLHGSLAPLLRSLFCVYFIGFFVLNFHLEWSFQDLPPTSGDDRFFPSLLGPMFVDGKNGREFLEALGVRKLHTCFWRYHEPSAKWGAAKPTQRNFQFEKGTNGSFCVKECQNMLKTVNAIRVLLVKELSECCEALPQQIAECKRTRAISIHNCLLQLHFM